MSGAYGILRVRGGLAVDRLCIDCLVNSSELTRQSPRSGVHFPVFGDRDELTTTELRKQGSGPSSNSTRTGSVTDLYKRTRDSFHVRMGGVAVYPALAFAGDSARVDVLTFTDRAVDYDPGPDLPLGPDSEQTIPEERTV
ncbi:hypothetical protein EVAR_69171_1 [Eumeta japonica]|uniref:Uncharacterized protein n=1 Tax=Eumeta variegata TaxID=151549 RepID=A0A4C1ZH87_EUMVA|nr:hypothetical protein EVAR_69171_1 [Eumeta japonica]